MDYITPKEAAERWGISERRVEALCANSQISGAERAGGKVWLIPKTTPKPIDGRTKAGKSLVNRTKACSAEESAADAPVIFSFFSGSGFLDLGFEREGYDVAFVNELSPSFMRAY